MKNRNKKNKILSEAVVLLITAVFIVSTSAVVADTSENVIPVTVETHRTFVIGSDPSSLDEIEIKYYDDDTAGQMGVGLQGGTPPYLWKSAIRLTQDELEWVDGTLIAVNALHMEEAFPHDVDIEIYGEGTATRPGDLITSEPYYFDAVEWYRIDLTTPVSLDEHNELWIAVSWSTDDNDFPAAMDGIPAVDGKGDHIYINNGWVEAQTFGADFDHNWAIGAIVEGEYTGTELGITDPTGPIGVTAGVKNIGNNPAVNVAYSLTVTGGFLGLVDVNVSDAVAELAVDAEEEISSGIFFGFGSIDIVITASADNAVDEVSVTKSGFLLGFLVVGIK